MADIELVIKIPEEMYTSIHNGMRYTDDVRYIMDLIENGTPLPKGHGRLIDADVMDMELGAEDKDIYASSILNEMLTIIEADKGG